MAHPPIRYSDLTFEVFFNIILEYKNNNTQARLGIKLDFKDPPAVEPCLSLLSDMENQIDFPIWINADILKGSGAKSPFNPNEFIKLSQAKIKDCILSLGWTTKIGGIYTDKQVDEMIDLCRKFKLKNVTFPIRASFFLKSAKQMKKLLDEDNTYSLTVWSGKEKFSDEDLDFITKFNERIFIDLGN